MILLKYITFNNKTTNEIHSVNFKFYNMYKILFNIKFNIKTNEISVNFKFCNMY